MATIKGVSLLSFLFILLLFSQKGFCNCACSPESTENRLQPSIKWWHPPFNPLPLWYIWDELNISSWIRGKGGKVVLQASATNNYLISMGWQVTASAHVQTRRGRTSIHSNLNKSADLCLWRKLIIMWLYIIILEHITILPRARCSLFIFILIASTVNKVLLPHSALSWNLSLQDRATKWH